LASFFFNSSAEGFASGGSVRFTLSRKFPARSRLYNAGGSEDSIGAGGTSDTARSSSCFVQLSVTCFWSGIHYLQLVGEKKSGGLPRHAWGVFHIPTQRLFGRKSTGTDPQMQNLIP